MKKLFRKLYFKIFERYNVLETVCVTYIKAEKMLEETHGKPDGERWVLSELEDRNIVPFMVYLCRKVRIVE